MSETTSTTSPPTTTTEATSKTTIPKKKSVDKKTVAAVAGIAIIATFTNAIIMQGRTIDDLRVQLKIANMRADVNNEFANDILLSTMKASYQGMSEQIVRGQGRIEGIVHATNPENKPDYMASWHDGYNRGLNQTEDEKQSFYEQGYQDAKSGKDLRLVKKSEIPIPQKAVLKKEETK